MLRSGNCESLIGLFKGAFSIGWMIGLKVAKIQGISESR
jgi:hypothetical protein